MSADDRKKTPKRRKTAAACDYCKSHKLKCDFSSEVSGPVQICKHCSDFGIKCHITARVKSQRASTNVATQASALDPYSSSPQNRWRARKGGVLTDSRYSGPTSLSQLVAAVTQKWPSRADRVLSKMGSQYGHIRVEGVSGGPFLMLPQVRYPPEQVESKEMENAKISMETKRDLLSKYQRFIAPVFPLLSDKESEEAVELDVVNQPITLLSNLGIALLSVAAMTRSTSIKTRMTLLYHLRRRPHVEISSSLEAIQYLLLLSANVEILSPDTNNSTGMSLNLTGLVTRMAQDLGLHRKLSQLGLEQHDLSRRARIWAACIVQDRWYSLSYGQPCLIQLEDCDAPHPSPYHDDVIDSLNTNVEQKPYEVHVEHFKLSILMSRLLRLVFTPSGLLHTSIEDLEKLQEDLDLWSEKLPASLQVSGLSGESVSIGAGFLHLLKVAIDFIFYRAALLSSHNTSKKASMYPPRIWDSLVKRSAEAISWVQTSAGTSVLDAWSVAMYAVIQCCFVQFYATINGNDPASLYMARKCLHSWSSSIEAQSHGYYAPQAGDEPLTSSTTTSAQPSTSSEKGKKSLTLRTKAYTLVAMLTGIADHHVNARRTQSPAPSPAGPASSAAASHARQPSAAMGHSRMPTEKGRLDDGDGGGPGNGPAPSAYNFNAVLNPDNSRPLLPHAAHGVLPPPQPFSSSASMTPTHDGRPGGTDPYEGQALSSSSMIPNQVGGLGNGSNDGLDQIDLVTLLRWADEVMGDEPNVEARYPLQSQPQQQYY